MSENDDSSDRATDRIVNALLQGLYESDVDRERRIQQLLTRYGETQQDPVSQHDRHDGLISHRQNLRVTRRWLSLFVAASILCLCFGSWFLFSPSSAQAAMARTIKRFQQPVIRVYDIQFTFYGNEQKRDGQATLYTQSKDRFLLHFDRFPVQPAMAGANGDRRWVRLGMRAWKSDDGSNYPAAFVLDRFAEQQLQLNRLMTEVPDNFSLRWIDDATLPGSELSCHRLVATRRFIAPALPQQLVLWIDPQTDLTRRIEATFRAGGPQHVESFVATFRGDEPFSESFFDAESHQ